MQNFHILRPIIAKAIRLVEDPELFISIVDLGLLYGITFEEKDILKISLTLTTIGCPLFETIEKKVRQEIEKVIPREMTVKIDIVFDPPWSMEMIAPNARAELGIL